MFFIQGCQFTEEAGISEVELFGDENKINTVASQIIDGTKQKCIQNKLKTNINNCQEGEGVVNFEYQQEKEWFEDTRGNFCKYQKILYAYSCLSNTEVQKCQVLCNCQNNECIAPPTQCNDTIDNDGDGKIDLSDIGCSSSDDNDEYDTITQCNDGEDNDNDDNTDLVDPGCGAILDNDETDSEIDLFETQTKAAEFPMPTPTQGEPLQNWWNDIVEICNKKYNLNPYLIAAMVKKESWFDEKAENLGEKEAYLAGDPVWFESYYGKGLTQITGPWIAGVSRPRIENWEYNIPVEAVWEEAPVMNDPFNGRENLARGCWYLDVLMKHYNNDEYSATTAYNKGFFGTDAGNFNVRDNDYINDVMKYKTEYLASI